MSDLFPSTVKIETGNNLLFLINILPDFLWNFSLANFLFTFSPTTKAYYNYLVLAVLLFAEVIQLFLRQYFTFDYFDLLAAFIAWRVSLEFKNMFYEK
ncbi:MAG: hypothetical protein QM725_04935 [Lacibacter sp.]